MARWLCALASLLLLLGCQAQPANHAVRGIITNVEQRDIAHAASITLRAESGETMQFKVADSVTFPPGHLREHMVFAEPVTVTYVDGPDGKVATTITD